MTTRRGLDHQLMADQVSPEHAGDTADTAGRAGYVDARAADPVMADDASRASVSATDQSERGNPDATDRDRASAARRSSARAAGTSEQAAKSPIAGGDRDTSDTSGDAADRATPSISDQDGTASSASDVEPTSAADDTNRTGVDTRRRGWFWHWNNVVTQYAPLIGLKGVGLLNSYTVWTDRRDESPHRGYAFPSQQSEADFYGEDRAELITINKILVALDLIEIRKEMLTRTDERGRRWRVPHNLYRVKDRPDGVDLRARDVHRVAELALTDDAVFRYVRRVFSERFKPIDGDNVWHRILDELRTDPTWRELQERTSAIEARASARSRAGHKRRNGSTAGDMTVAPQDEAATPDRSPDDRHQSADDTLLPVTQQDGHNPTSQRTSVDHTNTGVDHRDETVVDQFNSGSAIVVDETNSALPAGSPSIVAGSSNALQPVVAPSNTTYDQYDLTTTTTTTSLRDEVTVGATSEEPLPAMQRLSAAGGNQDDTVPRTEPVADVKGNGRDLGLASSRPAAGQRLATMEENDDERLPTGARNGGDPRERRLADPSAGGPMVDPGPLVVSTFEAANDRRATPLERNLLAELERDADPAARAAGSTGAEWIVAAMREAVASGSAFVAPKRIREIITRWSSDPRHAPASTTTLNGKAGSSADFTSTDDVRLPGGASGNAIWSATLSDLARTLDQTAFDRLLAGSRITRYWRGTAEVTVASSAAADKLSNEYRSLIERQLNSRLRRPVAVRFVASESPVETPEDGVIAEPVSDAAPQPLAIDEEQVEIGRQVWQSLLADLGQVVARPDLDRLAGVVVLGQDPAGSILLGTPSPLARRLIDRRYRADIERSLAALFGQSLPVRTLDASDWTIVNVN